MRQEVISESCNTANRGLPLSADKPGLTAECLLNEAKHSDTHGATAILISPVRLLVLTSAIAVRSIQTATAYQYRSTLPPVKQVRNDFG